MALLFFAFTSNSQNTAPPDTVSEVTVSPVTDDDSDETTTTDEVSTDTYLDTLKQNYRTVFTDTVDAINHDKGFYYKTYLDSLLRASIVKKEETSEPVDLTGTDFFGSIFGIIFWIVAIGLFGFLVYKLFLSDSALFSRNRKNISSEIDVAAEEETGDIDGLLRNAIRSGNYRLAIRYLYIQSLEKLAEKKFIEISSNKTNYEYVSEVRKQSFANDFASLTLQYEYVWYGEYPVDERLFTQIQNGFTLFNKNLTR